MPEFDKRLIIGGGLAGLAAAYWCKRHNPSLKVALHEKEENLLAWSGRKNLGPVILGRMGAVEDLSGAEYPRGWPQVSTFLEKWPVGAIREWLESLGLPIEELPSGIFRVKDGACLAPAFEKALRQTGVEIRTGYSVESVSPQSDGSFRLWSREGNPEGCRFLLLATGGERNHGLALARALGTDAAPSLPGYVRLRLSDPKLGDRLGPLEGIIHLRCPKSGFEAGGEAVLSARGLEGEAVSGLSCRLCEEWLRRGYHLQLEVDWIAGVTASAVRAELSKRCQSGRRRQMGDDPLFGLSSRQWLTFLSLCRIDPDTPWIRLKAKKLQTLVQRLKGYLVSFDGMGLPAGERAWAGGIGLDQVNPATGQALGGQGLFLAGEILDVLGKPGGYHPNLIWATAYVAGRALALHPDPD